MTLELHSVTKDVGGETHIHPTSLTLERGGFTILLGTTRAGKTTLMQLMAGTGATEFGARPVRRARRDRGFGAKAQCRDGASAIRQLPLAQRL